MSRLSEVTGLQQQRSLKYDMVVKKGNSEEITKAAMENIVMSLNDISATLAMIADGQSGNKSDTMDSIARSLAMMANSN
ncbi:hypothetical protein [Butyrivibrio sp. AE3004]|uniref:hypothetical protein n=1 Tax=Butyrivibrio sp. AE3004 TaxID=1506994 RepID=UPI000494731E|nr:hypothetical protein [Butyrivibrio sp. AE3004]